MKIISFSKLITESKVHETKFWKTVFDHLDKKLPKYNTKKVTDYNKVKTALANELFAGNIGELNAGQVALDYDDYRKGQVSKDEAIKKVVKFMHKFRRR